MPVAPGGPVPPGIRFLTPQADAPDTMPFHHDGGRNR